MHKQFEGIYPPITTPFDDEGKISFGSLEKNLSAWVEQPLTGVVMPGSNGEAVFLSYEEKLQIWELCAQVLKPKGKLLIAGTGVETTSESIALSEQAAERGAQAVLVQPPGFYKSQMGHEALMAHFTAVADASPVSVILYNVPQFTGVDFPLRTILALAKHSNIIGIKDSSINLVKMNRVLAAATDFMVFSGTGSALLGYLAIGGAGGIMALANIAPRRLYQILTFFREGKVEAAQKLQHSLAELNSSVTATYGVPGLKYAMDRLGLYGGPCRKPLLPLSDQDKIILDHLIDKAELTAFK